MKNSKSIAEESIIIARRHENVKILQQFAILREYNVVFMCILWLTLWFVILSMTILFLWTRVLFANYD